MNGAADLLARVRLSLGQLQAVLVACIFLSLAALVLVVYLVSTRADVARAEARRAVEQSEQTRRQANAADCALIDLLRTHPGDPPRTTQAGRQLADRAEAAYTARGCR